MIVIYKTPTCAYCAMVAKYLDVQNVPYRLEAAEGDTYGALAKQYGVSVPLVFNEETKKGMIGFNIAKLKELVGL